MPELDERHMQWVRDRVEGEVLRVAGLRDGGSPWLISSGERSVVLRVGPSDAIRLEEVGMRLAAAGGVAVPSVLAADVEHGLLLTTAVRGSSAIPVERATQRLRALGAAAAALHAVPVPSTAAMPRRTRPIAGVDFAALRAAEAPYPVFVRAEQAIADRRPGGADGFVHGDLWQGNVMWSDDGAAADIVALIDWDCAGVGPAGVDLGSLRADAALCFGVDAADDVLAGWQHRAGRPAEDVAYWDVVAALSSPADMGWFTPTIRAQGRPDLDRDLLVARRDDFLERALVVLAGG